MKKTILLFAVMLTLLLTGCEPDEVVEVDTETPKLEVNFETGQTSVTEEIEVVGETFTLVCTYDTGKTPLDNWRVTSNKSINITVNTQNLPEGYCVYMEHMHADIILKSTEPQIDGITQDSMDDSDHRSPSKGFLLNDTICYNTTFAIEGYTDQFYQIWGYAFGEYGHISSSYKRLTERNIRNVGTYAEKLTVVYDIVVITPECPEGYVKSICSEILIPLPDVEQGNSDVLVQ